jgi:hypothetical protein
LEQLSNIGYRSTPSFEEEYKELINIHEVHGVRRIEDVEYYVYTTSHYVRNDVTINA